MMRRMTTIKVGHTSRFQRIFSEHDVRAFTAVSGDTGDHHVVPGADGRLLVHGLLTATLPTKLGGDLNYLARTMTFEFLKPVWTGDEITVVAEVAELVDHPRGQKAQLAYRCTNQDGVEVMRGYD